MPTPAPGSVPTVRASSHADDGGFETKTPIGMPPDEEMAFRVSRTISRGTLELRREMKSDIRDQNLKIEKLDEKVDKSTVAITKVETKLDTVVDLLKQQLDASNERQELTLTAKLNVGQQTALVPVEDAKARRANIAKVVALFTSAGFILALIKILRGG